MAGRPPLLPLDDWPRVPVVYKSIKHRLLTIGEADEDQHPRSDMAITGLAQRHEQTSLHGVHTLDMIAASILRPATFVQVLAERCPEYQFTDMRCYPGDTRRPIIADPPKAVPFHYQACANSILVRIWYFPSETLLRRLRQPHSHAELLAALEPFHHGTDGWHPSDEYNLVFNEALDESKFFQTWEGETREDVLHVAIERASDARDPVVLDRFDHAVVELWETLKGGAAYVQFGCLKRDSQQPRRWRLVDDHSHAHYFLPRHPGTDPHFVPLPLEGYQYTLSLQKRESIDWSLYDSDLCSTFVPTNAAANSPEPAAGSAKGEAVVPAKITDAKTVMNRIRYDPNIHGNDVVVQYVDRHEGLMSKRFSEWVSETTHDEFIPTHRIRQFSRAHDGMVLWDRKKRIDTFGKGGG